jgi:hypothetical protein
MAWGFHITCPDCQHQWSGVVSTCWLGSLTQRLENVQELFCSRCYGRLVFPRVVERKTWQHWYNVFVAQGGLDSAFLRGVTSKINALLGSRNWYTPTPIHLQDIQCPECDATMEPSCPDGDRLVCPRCGSRSAVLTDFDSHLQLCHDPDGFM